MTDRLRDALTGYFGNHPGGDMAFYQNDGDPLDARTLQDTFERAFRGSKWSVVRGYHVFRHSFASNLARAGVDERTVDELMGHETEAMRKRYRHLFPDARKKAVAKLYG
jgi:integrase